MAKYDHVSQRWMAENKFGTSPDTYVRVDSGFYFMTRNNAEAAESYAESAYYEGRKQQAAYEQSLLKEEGIAGSQEHRLISYVRSWLESAIEDDPAETIREFAMSVLEQLDYEEKRRADGKGS